jgi:hypothetical protein
MEKPILVLDLCESDVEAVIREFELEHPGKTARDMSPAEFADRVMKKIKASAKMMPLSEALE